MRQTTFRLYIAVVILVALLLVFGVGSSWFTNGDVKTWFNSWGAGTEKTADSELTDGDETDEPDATDGNQSDPDTDTSSGDAEQADADAESATDADADPVTAEADGVIDSPSTEELPQSDTNITEESSAETDGHEGG